MQTDVIIIGAGVSGLIAAFELQKARKRVVVLEAAAAAGGRIASETVKGYVLDKGFQILLTAYPEARKYLDYKALRLHSFIPGAILLKDGKTYKVADPIRCSALAIPSLMSPAGSIQDKVKLFLLRQKLKNKSLEDIFKQAEAPTREVLKKEYGFSNKMIRNFMEPFLAGIFLEKELYTSRRMFDFVFKMFMEGKAAIPEKGMQEIPRQLAAKLKPGTIRYHHQVKEIGEEKVILADGNVLQARNILIATEACGLLKDYLPDVKSSCQSTTNIYFTADKVPIRGKFLILNTHPDRFVNNMTVISEVSRAYAPAKKNLISVSVNGLPDGDLQEAIKRLKEELRPYFGKQVNEWHHLKTYKIRYALPNQAHVQHQLAESSIRLRKGVYICGDHLLNGSINGAMRSGAFAAEVIKREGFHD